MAELTVVVVASFLIGVIVGQLGTWGWIRNRYRIPRHYAVHKWIDEVAEGAGWRVKFTS